MERNGKYKKDFGPIFFTEEKRELNTNLQVTVGTDIQFQADAAATAATKGVAANTHLKINFKKKNSFFFWASEVSEFRYPSIEGEIKPFLAELLKQYKWNEDYWVVVSTIQSSNFISLLSTSAGINVDLACDAQGVNDIVALEKLDGNIHFSLINRNDAILCVTPNEKEPQFAGAKFIKLSKERLFRKRIEIRYTGENDNNIDSIDLNEDSIEEIY